MSAQRQTGGPAGLDGGALASSIAVGVCALVGLVFLAILGCSTTSTTPAQQPTRQGPVPSLNLQVKTAPVKAVAEPLPTPPPKVDPLWENAKREALERIIPFYVHNKAELMQGLERYQIERGLPWCREVALTFDDGPHPESTPKLLEVLRKYNAKATFFVVGSMARKHPDLVAAEVAEGHAVGNHTYNHRNMTSISPEEAAIELRACGDVLRDITGSPTRLFRPPGGRYSRETVALARAEGYTTVFWTVNTADYTEPSETRVAQRVLWGASNGAVFLLHDGYQETIDALPRILQNLQSRGYRFVTVNDFIGDRLTKM
jgi:peptidoglycan/xylan/chitin deacetylase (PgdA/CDA1 family)